MTDGKARVLARDGNVAVTQLAGRAFPGIHMQGDTFAVLQRQIADAVSQLRHARDGTDAWDDLESVVDEMTRMLLFYESVLEEHGFERPYFRERAD